MIPIADIQIRFRADSKTAQRDVQQLQNEIQELRQSLGQTDRTATAATQAVDRLGDEAKEAAIGVTSLGRNLNDDMIQANQVLEALRSELSRYSAIVRIAEDNANTYALSSQLLAASQEALTESIRAADAALRDGAISYGEYVAAAARVRENIEALSGGQAALNDFWRVASGQVEDYTESIQTTIPSLVNLTEAENALTAAIEANLQTLRSATGDPLSDYIDGLTLTSRSADDALGTINQLGEAVRDADFRTAEQELRDFNDAFKLSEATIPRVTSEMRKFAGQVPPATAEVIEFRRELETLNRTGQDIDLSSVADALNIGADPLRGARHSGQDAYFQHLRDNAINIGEELGSQAIRTAGELRRIEQERVENLEDLEREYSEQIIAINERKRERLAEVEQEIEEERVQRLASIEQAFEDASNAEIEARQDAADRIQQIEEQAAADRERLRERLNDRLIALEERRDDRIQGLSDGFIEREQDRQQEILEITERAAEARAAAEQQYAAEVQAINNRLFEDVLALQRELAAEIESLESGFVQRHAERADEIVRITEEAADARAAANRTFTDTMQGIYNDLVEAWDDLEEGFTERQEDRAAERVAIEQRAVDARIAANEAYSERVARISTDLVDEVRRIEAEIVDVQASAALERTSIEQDALDARAEATANYARQFSEIERDRVSATAAYSARVARISTDLVDEVRRIEAEIVDVQAQHAQDRIAIEQESIDSRAAANADYAQRLDEIETNRARQLEESNRRLAEIQQEAAAARLSADAAYANRFQDIQNDLVDRVVGIQKDLADSIVDIQRDLNDTLNDLQDEQLDAERERAESLVELHEETQQKLEDLERSRTQTVEDLRRKFQQDQLDAATALDRELQDAGGDPEQEAAARQKYQRRIEDLTREFHRRQIDLQINQRRQREALARQAAAKEIEIAERAQAQQARIAQQQVDARSQAQAGIAAQRAQAQEGITAAESAAGVAFQKVQTNYVPALSAHEQALLAHAEALNRINQESSEATAGVNEARTEIIQESLDAAAAAAQTLSETLSAVTVAEQERLSALQTETSGTLGGLNQQITDAEAQTGLSFEEALVNYTPAVDLNTQALQALTEALDSISAAEVSAGQTLNETLSAVTVAEQERLTALQTETSGTLGGLNQQITDAEARTGLSFEEALVNYTPAVDLNTQALQALTEALEQAESERTESLGTVDAAGAADRLTTQTAQQALETGAGVSIEDARANFVPALSSAAQATLTLNETMRELESSFNAAIAEIQTAGLVDRQAVDAAVQAAIADATAQQTVLETQAGTTFAEASAAFQPGISDIAQAGIDRDTTLSGIDQSETEDIDAVNAQSLADRLETDAAITETRDAYIKARDAVILQHNTAMLQLNIAEAADIKAVRATLRKNLESIDEKLDAELAEIQEAKIVFDTRIGELINKINEQANFDVANLKEDTAAMRTHLEELAAEARDNAWKGALLKIASTGITVAGVAIGTAAGNPVAGFAVGQAVGNLVEQGGNELFHYEQTDRIARRIARQSALSRSRSAPNYLPDANQIRNARDVSREIVAGVTEGLAIGERRDGGLGDASQQASFPEEISATLVLEWPDGATIELADQILRLRAGDRTNL